jgi:hypothetical protein
MTTPPEPLTKEHFEKWHVDIFQPHVDDEEQYHDRVNKLWWTGIVAIAMGGIIMSMFVWILLQKDADIKEIQKTQLSLMLDQRTDRQVLLQLSEEVKRQAIDAKIRAETDAKTLAALLSTIETRNEAWKELLRRSGATVKPHLRDQ